MNVWGLTFTGNFRVLTITCKFEQVCLMYILGENFTCSLRNNFYTYSCGGSIHSSSKHFTASEGQFFKVSLPTWVYARKPIGTKGGHALTFEPRTVAWEEISSISFPSRIWHWQQSSQTLTVGNHAVCVSVFVFYCVCVLLSVLQELMAQKNVNMDQIKFKINTYLKNEFKQITQI